uniref:RRM domain-containing protein n=1 Tax=Chromera velia CCMP2878 TaxID=1169474 RepID=A0A0G4HEB9_9ALVE|eukprot:Cvel_26606.t1-p1 / transcript=Cvel_26606.t1 / gene=Cvel_26606 / organism=Chromera_velia_CCMP2878 / gene_product=CUGBP Elav-like family member 1, putative / transcript_product=CUGBP Elav-like family member 1, putative / location=Cvel_scaffold3190:15207-17145(+) / protein_length=394 / sequence_SO=supercontig / SO=protein_coding / is_pseudo=false
MEKPQLGAPGTNSGCSQCDVLRSHIRFLLAENNSLRAHFFGQANAIVSRPAHTLPASHHAQRPCATPVTTRQALEASPPPGFPNEWAQQADPYSRAQGDVLSPSYPYEIPPPMQPNYRQTPPSTSETHPTYQTDHFTQQGRERAVERSVLSVNTNVGESVSMEGSGSLSVQGSAGSFSGQQSPAPMEQQDVHAHREPENAQTQQVQEQTPTPAVKVEAPPGEPSEDFIENIHGSNLFVFHLPSYWNDDDLQMHFRTFGAIKSAIVAKEAETGRKKGFGFVCFEEPSSALEAIAGMNGYAVGGKRLSVQLKQSTMRKRITAAPPPTASPPTSMERETRESSLTSTRVQQQQQQQPAPLPACDASAGLHQNYPRAGGAGGSRCGSCQCRCGAIAII